MDDKFDVRKLNQQFDYIYRCYKYSEKNYMNRYINQNVHLFLNDLDNMNVFPIYPEMIVCKFKTFDEDIKLNQDYDLSDFDIRSHKMRNIYVKVNNKIDELKTMQTEIIEEARKANKKLKIKNKAVKFFNYEVEDYISDTYNIKPMTKAFLKCYELLFYFKLLDLEKDVNSFHICELPGGFIMACNHYVKTNSDKQFIWNAQSFNPKVAKDKSKFLPDEYGLANKYKNNYDWGVSGDGDITNIDNIKHYHKTYLDKDFVTSDCGQDSSENFKKQEEKLNKVFWSQFVCMLGVLKKGGNHIAKIFTISTYKMIEMMYLLCNLFDEVYIAKPIKTRPTSGERYIVCKGYKGCTKKFIDSCFTYLEHFDDRQSFFDLNIITDEFIDDLTCFNYIMGYRRITNFNRSMFVMLNAFYINENIFINHATRRMANYYIEYYGEYHEYKKIDNKDKLL